MIGVIGYLCEDFFPEISGELAFVPGKLQEIGSMPGRPGGVVGNTGGALCKLGADVRLGVMTADDQVGIILRAVMEEYAPNGGVEHVIVKGKSSAASLVFNPPGQDRMFFCCRGVNDLMTSQTYPDRFFDGLSMLHFGYPSLSLSMSANDGEETYRLFERCHAKGIATSMDLSLPAVDTPFYNLDWKAFFAKVLPQTDFFCPSIDEIRGMLRDETSSPEQLADYALSLGCHAVLLKMGKAGLMVRTADRPDTEVFFRKFGNGKWRGVSVMVPASDVKVINATGAGDTAIAGFLASVAAGLDCEKAARTAEKTASCRISSPDGIHGIPPLKNVISMI